MFGKLFGKRTNDPNDAVDATAEVLGIEDTGGRMGTNPVVRLRLQVQPATGAAFETTGKCMVSAVSMPRVGDQIRIRYSPADPTQISVM